MKRKLATLATSVILVAALIGLMIPVQALGTPFTIYGQVFDSDGTTPVDGVTVMVTNLATTSSVPSTVTASGGWYSVNLGNLKPNEAHAAGDNIEISADDGAGKTSTTVVPRAASSPQLVNLVLQIEPTPTPTLTPTPTPIPTPTATPAPTPAPTARRISGGGTPVDTDGDGFTDVDEILAGTNPNDPKDYPGAAAKTPTPTPTLATPTSAPATPVPTPTAAPTATPTPATPTPEEPGFEALLAIGGLLAIAFVILRRKQ